MALVRDDLASAAEDTRAIILECFESAEGLGLSSRTDYGTDHNTEGKVTHGNYSSHRYPGE